MIFMSIILIILMCINLSIMFRVLQLTERIDDNLVDIEMMKMQVEQVTKKLQVDVALLQEKIGGI